MSPTAAALLADLKPFIRDVHVVEASRGPNVRPIVGGTASTNQVPIPSDLAAFPSKRWVITPEFAAHHRTHFGAISNADLRTEDQRELDPMAIPLLQRRYGDRENLTVVEMGAATSTVVPRALGPKLGHYFATDVSVPLLERQQDLVSEPGYLVASAYHVQGDTYNLPYESGTADVAFTSCHPPFASASPAERIQAFGEVARVLKPGGEFVLFPWKPQDQHPAVSAFVQKNFELVDGAVSPLSPDRQMAVFRRRG